MPHAVEVANQVAQRVLKGVLEESTLEPEELDMVTGAAGRVGAAYQRFVSNGSEWVVREAVPGRLELVIFAIFAGDVENDDDNNPGDVRIYAMPVVEGAPFVRYMLSRLHPTLLGLALDEQRFVEALAQEWDDLAVRFGISEGTDDSVICPKCSVLTETRVEDEDEEDPEPVFCGGCGEKLPPPEPEKPKEEPAVEVDP